MNFREVKPARTFRVGVGGRIEIRECARIGLDADEQITLVAEAGAEYDIVRKSWGYYATPSLNGRLSRSGLRAVLIKGSTGNFFLLLVEKGKEEEFRSYLAEENLSFVAWMDSPEALARLENAGRREA